MDQNAFSNLGQFWQFIFGGISAFIAALSFIRSIPARYRYWLGGLPILGLCIARFGFDWLPHWLDWIIVLLAMCVAYRIGRFSTPPASELAGSESLAPLRLLRVKLHISKDEGVQYKKKLVITLRNMGQHGIIVGPKTNWVPGDMSVYRLDQLVWELEPKQDWDSDGWKWQQAEFPELYVPQGIAFRTWVPLHENATEAEVERLKERLGTLRTPLA